METRVIGHTDTDEFNEGKINPRYRELGYSAEKWSRSSVSLGSLRTGSLWIPWRPTIRRAPATGISRAKNRRVVFELVK